MPYYPKKKTAYRKKSYTKSKSKISKKTLTKFVKKVLKRQLEKKTQQFSAAYSMSNASNLSFSNNTQPLTPTTSSLVITQGVGQGARLGNEVSVTGATLNLMMFPNPYTISENTVPMPQGIELFIWSVKGDTQTLAGARTITTTNFFQNGSSSTGFSGNNFDHMVKPNLDKVTPYFHGYYKLGAANYQTNTGTQANQFSFANNDYKLNHNVKVNLMEKGFPKKLIWNDNTDTATSRQLFFTISPWDCDGGANADTITAVPCNFEYIVEVEYTDA